MCYELLVTTLSGARCSLHSSLHSLNERDVVALEKDAALKAQCKDVESDVLAHIPICFVAFVFTVYSAALSSTMFMYSSNPCR